jgi:hypothetical protein
MTGPEESSARRPRGLAPPSWPLLLVLVVVAAAYLDLKTDLIEHEARLGAIENERGPHEEPRLALSAGAAPRPPAPEQPPPAPARPPRPQVERDWACPGTLAPEEVRDAVGANGRAIFDCYRSSLGRGPAPSGTLLLELRVGPEGQVEDARVRGPLQQPALLGCVSEHVFGWRFPRPRGGACAVVSAPFHLAPDATGPGEAGTR